MVFQEKSKAKTDRNKERKRQIGVLKPLILVIDRKMEKISNNREDLNNTIQAYYIIDICRTLYHNCKIHFSNEHGHFKADKRSINNSNVNNH